MQKISIKAQWVGQQVVIKTTTNPSFMFHASTLESGLRALEQERKFEVSGITWMPPLQSADKVSSPYKPAVGKVVNELV
tara:strand:- start:3014 stop:3250 length:237 start_codon:yes stop_codon:yes gene_type:complete